MCDSQELQEWMQQHGISQTMLAKRLQCTRSTINRILNGKSKASPMLKARIKELMTEQEATITAVVPDEMEAILHRWANEAHMSIQQLLDDLLSKLPKPGQQ